MRMRTSSDPVADAVKARVRLMELPDDVPLALSERLRATAINRLDELDESERARYLDQFRPINNPQENP